MNTQISKPSERRGTWFAVLSGLLYGLLGYFGVSLMQSGLAVANVSFWRFLSASIFLLVVFLFTTKKHGSWRQNLFTLLNGGLFYGIPGNLFFVSSSYIGTGQAMVIFFIFPVFVMLLNWIFLKQAIRPYYILSFILILSGLVLMVDIGEVKFDFIGIGLSILAAFSYAIYVFLSKRVASLPVLNSSLMVSLGCTFSCGILGMVNGSLSVPTEIHQWWHIAGIGIICSALPILLLFEALKNISSEKASMLSVLEPVFVVIFGVMLLGEVLNINTVFGILLTLAGAMSISIKWNAAFIRFKRAS